MRASLLYLCQVSRLKGHFGKLANGERGRKLTYFTKLVQRDDLKGQWMDLIKGPIL